MIAFLFVVSGTGIFIRAVRALIVEKHPLKVSLPCLFYPFTLLPPNFPWMGCLSITGSFPAVCPVNNYTPGWPVHRPGSVFS